jgi:TetR/AcrR family transcriptional repressor of nem operon
MGRSSQAQASRNRALIVDKASRLFREHGVDKVSVADVMTAAGMTVGGFYKHFPSKAALVQEALALAFQEASTVWGRIVEREQDHGHQTREAIVRHYFHKRSPDKTCPMLAFAPHLAGQAASDDCRSAYNAGVESLLRVFGEAGTNRIADNAPASDPQSLLLFAAMVGAGLISRAAGDAEWARTLRDAVESAASDVDRSP